MLDNQTITHTLPACGLHMKCGLLPVSVGLLVSVCLPFRPAVEQCHSPSWSSFCQCIKQLMNQLNDWLLLHVHAACEILVFFYFIYFITSFIYLMEFELLCHVFCTMPVVSVKLLKQG
ncbi:hypothetical protein AMECASPLE_026781 [Ameca splendens]|uniref:Uncharacterized protein n=1 Tax=Ameca splendens TaxID=208324 RepID=A0ABV1A3L5_9TELE